LASRFLISSLKSGMRDSRYASDGLDETTPVRPLGGENFGTSTGEAIITAPPLPRFFNPATPDPAPLFQAVKQRIERRDVEMENAARAQLNQLTDLITMSRPVFDQGKNEQLGAALLQFTIEDVRTNIRHSHI